MGTSPQETPVVEAEMQVAVACLAVKAVLAAVEARSVDSVMPEARVEAQEAQVAKEVARGEAVYRSQVAE